MKSLGGSHTSHSDYKFPQAGVKFNQRGVKTPLTQITEVHNSLHIKQSKALEGNSGGIRPRAAELGGGEGGGGGGGARGPGFSPPILDLSTQTLHVDNQLLRSLLHQPPQSYFRSAATELGTIFSQSKVLIAGNM